MLLRHISGIVRAASALWAEMSPYLLFGFFIAGLVHLFIRRETITRLLGENTMGSVLRAALFGIPLPLCSCGVLPTALMLYNEGASIGAVLAFLIATPITGVDSILVTYALLGGFFTAYRVLVCLATALCAGFLGVVFFRRGSRTVLRKQQHDGLSCSACRSPLRTQTVTARLREAFGYGFGVLVRDSGPWLIGGALIGGLITYALPVDFFTRHVSSVWMSMIVMFLAGIPLYVCSSASVPIALALLAKGMNPAGVFVFLMTGPATNAAAMAVIGRSFGKRALAIFLLTLFFCAFAFGWLLDRVWVGYALQRTVPIPHHMASGHGGIFNYGAGILLLVVVIWSRRDDLARIVTAIKKNYPLSRDNG